MGELLKQAAPGLRERWCFAIRHLRQVSGSSLRFVRWRSPSVSSSRRLTCMTPARLSVGCQAFARAGDGGAIVTAGGTAAHRKLVIDLFARYKLPAIYPYRYYAADGGLISYGPNTHEPIRRAAGYVDRILKGEKPGDLPVQAPDKFELVVNLKTAKAMGLNIPQSLLARADEVIE
jgi:ABC-type uncharacterized transport system, periplasmic component